MSRPARLGREERIRRLEALAREANPARRRLVALALVSDRLREVGLDPILVGGAAVEFYTAGGYATADIDLALPHGPMTDAAFAELGFVLDRLRAWMHGTSDEDGRWARRLVLLYSDQLDWDYLRSKAGAVATEASALARLEEEARG